MFSFIIQMFQCKQCELHFFKFQNIFRHGVSSYGEGFSQLYLEPVDAYKKIFMHKSPNDGTLQYGRKLK